MTDPLRELGKDLDRIARGKTPAASESDIPQDVQAWVDSKRGRVGTPALKAQERAAKAEEKKARIEQYEHEKSVLGRAGVRNAEELAEIRRYLRPEEQTLLDRLVACEKPVFEDSSFLEQAAFIRSTARWIALLCQRRAGKSYGIADKLLSDAWEHPKSNYLYAGITLDSAKKAIWKDALQEIDAKLGLGIVFNETHSTATLPNGAVIYVIGMDRPDMLKRARGGKYRMVVIDECQDFSPTLLRDLVVKILQPTLTDELGTMVLAGTPGPVLQGIFFELTGDLVPEDGTAQKGEGKKALASQNIVVPDISEWSTPVLTPPPSGDGWDASVGWPTRVAHRDTAAVWERRCWATSSNPHMKEQIEKEIADAIAVNPLIVETPDFIRERKGIWYQDDKSSVYSYSRERNRFNPEKEGPGNVPDRIAGRRGSWHYVLGVDLGYDDASAFSVCAYHDFDTVLYVLESEKEAKLIFDQVADRIRVLQQRYDFDVLVIDGANKQGVEQMRQRQGLPLTAAEKQDKYEFIRLMNSDFKTERIKLHPFACMVLEKEYGGLVWDRRKLDKGEHKEHPSLPNHCADATLYAWRHCYQYLSAAPKEPPKPGTQEWYVAEAARMREEAEKQAAERIRQAKEAKEEDATDMDLLMGSWEGEP